MPTKTTTPELIDLDELLHGSPSWKQVVDFWKDPNCEWYEESYLIEAIKKFLRTEEQRRELFELDLSIEDCMNGRYTTKQSKRVRKIYKEWNKKLGFKAFQDEAW
jgi:hypothetical protein